MSDKIYYIEASATGVGTKSHLLEQIRASKMAQAPAEQWINMIKALSQKGVKNAEIEDSKILEWLRSKGKERTKKEDVLTEVLDGLPKIKVVDLSKPKFKNFSLPLEGKYIERLYILSSKRMSIEDKIEDLFYRITDLGFDPSPMMNDPGIVDRLESEMRDLQSRVSIAWDFASHHYSNISEEHRKNLMAHARFHITNDTIVINEIQSDWAQKGRRRNWPADFPRAPFVTQTELWASLVLKDILRTAASNNSIKKVVWIDASMRNGAKTQSARDDGLDEFYGSIIKRCAQKIVGDTTNVRELTVPELGKLMLGVEMKESLRQKIGASLTLYSRAPLTSQREKSEEEIIRAKVMQECESILGSAHMVRFYNRLYDISTGNEVAGRYWNEVVEISLRAKDPIDAARHECLHFADENLLMPNERWLLRMEFINGSPLYKKTREILEKKGMRNAYKDSESPEECAAYAFELWCKGELDVKPEVNGLFEKIFQSLIDIGAWIKKMVNPDECQSVEEIFTSLRGGIMARRAKITATDEIRIEVNSDEDEWASEVSRPQN